ncbi:MAG: winged helix-turn-helix domain-containing protein [Hyphomicrobiales bacterium]
MLSSVDPPERSEGQDEPRTSISESLLALVLHTRAYTTGDVLALLLRQQFLVTERPFDENVSEVLQSVPPSLILFVVETGGEDEAEAIQEIRSQTAAPIILVLRTFNSSAVSEALAAGADCYLRESDGSRVLEALVGAWGQRLIGNSPPLFEGLQAGELILDPAARTGRAGGRSVHFTLMEFKLLRALMARPGQVLSPVEMLEAAGVSAPTSSATAQLKVYVLRIRRKLRRLIPDREVILNVRGSGYMFDRRHENDTQHAVSQ